MHRALEFLPKVSSKWREARVNTEQNALQTILTGSPCDILWSCSITSSSFLSRFIILFKKEKWRRSQYQIIRSLLPKLKSGSNCSKHEWLHNRVWFQCESQDQDSSHLRFLGIYEIWEPSSYREKTFLRHLLWENTDTNCVWKVVGKKRVKCMRQPRKSMEVVFWSLFLGLFIWGMWYRIHCKYEPQ